MTYIMSRAGRKEKGFSMFNKNLFIRYLGVVLFVVRLNMIQFSVPYFGGFVKRIKEKGP